MLLASDLVVFKLESFVFVARFISYELMSIRNEVNSERVTGGCKKQKNDDTKSLDSQKKSYSKLW